MVTHIPERDCCPDCGGDLRHFGDDISEQLEYVPESFKVIRHVRPKFTCTGCDRVVEAPAPSRPIERGLAGPGLLAHVIVSKFADHLPLYRQSEIYARQGVEISRSTMAGWVGAASDLLSPLVDAIRKHVLAGRKLHADDTPMPVLAPGNGKTKTGRLWTYVRDDRPAGEQTAPAVWFAYSEDRKGEHPRQHLKNFNGALQADAYAGFHHLYGNHIYEAACWAHARRKFHEIHVIHASPTTTEALARIGALYAIEDEIRGKPADLRLSIRQTRARPLLDDLRDLDGEGASLAVVEERDCRLRSDMRSRAGGPSPATPKMACSRSTTAPPSGRCELSLSDERTSSSSDPTAAANAPQPCTRSSVRPSSTDSIRNSISAPCWRRSQIIQSARSMICCPGTSRPHFKPTHLKPPKTHSSGVHHKKQADTS